MAVKETGVSAQKGGCKNTLLGIDRRWLDKGKLAPLEESSTMRLGIVFTMTTPNTELHL